MNLHGKKIDMASLSVEDVDSRDYPDFCDGSMKWPTTLYIKD